MQNKPIYFCKSPSPTFYVYYIRKFDSSKILEESKEDIEKFNYFKSIHGEVYLESWHTQASTAIYDSYSDFEEAIKNVRFPFVLQFDYESNYPKLKVRWGSLPAWLEQQIISLEDCGYNEELNLQIARWGKDIVDKGMKYYARFF